MKERTAVRPDKRPNVLIFHTDQQRYDSLGCTGNAYAETPNIDRLASEGTLFRRHVSASPVCMPSRASLFTGRYPNGHGVHTNGVALPRRDHWTGHPMNDGQPLNAGVFSHVPTMADAFSEAGYRTASIGKLHLTCTNAPRSCRYEESRVRWAEEAMESWSGPYYGFDRVELTIGHGEDYTGHYGRWLEREYPEVAARVKSGLYRGSGASRHTLYPSVVPVEAHSSTWIAGRAVSYLREAANDTRPFLLFLGFPDPHFPFVPPAELAERFASKDVPPAREKADPYGVPAAMRRLYRDDALQNVRRFGDGFVRLARQYTDAMLHLVDLSVGRVTGALRELGLEDDTIVLFTSDHGDYLGDYGLIFKSEFGCKALNHVPLLVKVPMRRDDWPGECRAAVSNADVLPTLCELAGVPAPDGVQGRSLVPLLEGRAPSSPVTVACYGEAPEDRNFSLWNDRYRYTWYPAAGECELYDHEADLGETADLAGTPEAAAVRQAMHAELLERHVRHDRPSAGKSSNW
ncbi:sulfatase family protein [Paenibacillus flagellatus]|nr:sulfatase-like hydrolase/transferase [Paenibacillus flagellatus]